MSVRWSLAAVGAVLTVLAVRVLIHASTFQLFGDYVARVDTGERAVALTFDDGPHPQHTRTVLDLLDRYHARATFFMLGRNVERFPDVVREVVARGHEIGNHSYSHPRLVFMSPARVREEITKTDELLRAAGVSGPIHFRPPHSAKLVILPHVLGRMGTLTVLADVDPEEWRRRGAEAMTADILRDVRPGSIVMLHEVLGKDSIETAVNVMRSLAADGYRFETVSGLMRAGGRRD